MRSDQRGFTMIELLVASAMMVVITGATVSLFVSALKDQARVTKSADKVGDVRTALRLMTDDIRQGSAVLTGSKAEELKLTTYVHAATCTSAASPTATAIACEVTYACSIESGKTTYQCTRKQSTGSAVKIVGGLSNAAVFTYTPTTATSATYVAAKLTVPASTGTGTIVFENGATMRNSATNLTY